MQKLLICCISVILSTPVFAENYLLNGFQESHINYQMIQQVHPDRNTQSLMLSYVIPVSFQSPTYHQTVMATQFQFSPEPSQKRQRIDSHGNRIVEADWETPPPSVKTTIHLTALNRVSLNKLKTQAPFPPVDLPEPVKIYLETTPQVAADNPSIRSKTTELTRDAETQFDAVQKILTWIVDHMQYVVAPSEYTALYAFDTGKGNCQNYSHLSAALMRAAGIPVRIVNGIVLKKPYDVNTEDTVLTLKMAEGRHSWIEVFFPDLGWVPFDPSGTELFVSNRFIRIEIGLDNHDTRQDGLIRWSHKKGHPGSPRFTESIDAGFDSDRIDVRAEKTNYGPRKLLLSPRVESEFTKIKLSYQTTIPEEINAETLKHLNYARPHTFGNLDFPREIDFLATRGPARKGKAGTMEMHKNFLVETAEYVTTQGRQYAQTFILKQPMLLKKVGIALHKFGGHGQLWIELFKDSGGRPGPYLTTSDIVELQEMKFTPGYDWLDFDFGSTDVLLSPGRYWIALGFTGSPIINWFFSYGKPVGPQDGTRYRTIFDEGWSRSLAFEFNYRVAGLVAE